MKGVRCKKPLEGKGKVKARGDFPDASVRSWNLHCLRSPTQKQLSYTWTIKLYSTPIQREDGLKTTQFYRNYPERDDATPTARDSFTWTITGAQPQH